MRQIEVFSLLLVMIFFLEMMIAVLRRTKFGNDRVFWVVGIVSLKQSTASSIISIINLAITSTTILCLGIKSRRGSVSQPCHLRHK